MNDLARIFKAFLYILILRSDGNGYFVCGQQKIIRILNLASTIFYRDRESYRTVFRFYFEPENDNVQALSKRCQIRTTALLNMRFGLRYDFHGSK